MIYVKITSGTCSGGGASPVVEQWKFQAAYAVTTVYMHVTPYIYI